jgi:hypothetical protein
MTTADKLPPWPDCSTEYWNKPALDCERARCAFYCQRLRVAVGALNEALNLLRDLRDLDAVEVIVKARVAIGALPEREGGDNAKD